MRAKERIIRRPHAEVLLPNNQDGEEQLVTLVCAPAGYGKTALVSSWARGRECAAEHVAWLDLDESDDDPATLWADVLGALGRALPEVRHDRLPTRQTDLSAHLADIVERQGKRVWLVLDDLHRLHRSTTVRALEMLLHWTPPNLGVVICTRRYPSLGLHRLRIAGLLREVRARDLALTKDEVKELVASQGVRLGRRALVQLVSMTQGWPVAVRLAALALADSTDHVATVDALPADDRAVTDFLTGEVLCGLTGAQQHLLRCVCVADTFTAELAVELTQRTEAPDLLTELERCEPLVSRRADDEFCEHPFLRAHLYAKLRRHAPASLAGLHRRAADWFARRGAPVAAARHAVRADDADLATRVVVGLGPELLLRGETALVLELAPVLHPTARAEVGLTLALAELMSGDRAAAELRMAGLTGELADNRDERVRDLALVVRAFQARMSGRADPAVDELGERLARISDPELLVLALLARGTALLRFDQPEAAGRDIEQALRLATTRGFDCTILQCRSYLGAVAAVRGDFPLMRQAAEEALSFAEERDLELREACCLDLLLAAAASYQFLELDRAAELVVRATDLLGPSIDKTVALAVLSLREAIEFEHGPDPYAAMVRLRAHWAKPTPDERIHPDLVAAEAATEQRMALRLGQIQWAVDVKRRASGWLGDTGEIHLLRARLLAHHGRVVAARHLLEKITSGAARIRIPSTMIEAYLLTAVLADRSGHQPMSIEHLRIAIELAEPRRALRPFFDVGPDIRQLLVAQMGRLGQLDGFVADLLDAIPASRLDLTADLTPREMQVLRELPSLATLEEIAESRYVSVNTVKTHIRNVYRKLGVSSRREAVVAARRRGLI